MPACVRPRGTRVTGLSPARTWQWSNGHKSWQAPPRMPGQRCGQRTQQRDLNLPRCTAGLQNRARLNHIFNFSLLRILRPTQTAPLPHKHLSFLPPSLLLFFPLSTFPWNRFFSLHEPHRCTFSNVQFS